MVHSEQTFVTAFFANRAFTNSTFGASVGCANNGVPKPAMVCEGIEPSAEAVAAVMNAAPAANREKEGMFSNGQSEESQRPKSFTQDTEGQSYICTGSSNLYSEGCVANNALCSAHGP